jgi:phosphohistidine phosphatase
MKLYLVQHGEAENKDTNSERPLTEKGHNDIRKLSQFLNQSDVQLGQVIHSGKLRAKETAEYFVKMLINPSSLVINDNINPNDSLEPLIEQIKSWNGDTLIVGHLPYLAKLVSYLTTNNKSTLTVSFQPGSIICLERDDELKWSINFMVRPELLSD